MSGMIERYMEKLLSQGLVAPGQAVLAERDDVIRWSAAPSIVGRTRHVLEELFERLEIQSLLFARPAEPQASIIDALARQALEESSVDGSARPRLALRDNETRLFLHDLPVVASLDADALVDVLQRRKSVIIPGEGVVTIGTVSPEQCFIVFSSVLFATFVKFFSDLLLDRQRGVARPWQEACLARVAPHLPTLHGDAKALARGPFADEAAAYHAVAEAGKPLIQHGLVDSVMGNISLCFDERLYISQTGSFLDELEGAVDPCPLDNSACTGLTASSELPAHLAIVRGAGPDAGSNAAAIRAVLHGHPRFAVIMSLFCEEEEGCPQRGKDRCHLSCPVERSVAGVPIVGGESGNGPRALARTVPAALAKPGVNAVIVYGHGVFTVGEIDFNEPMARLFEVERACRAACLAALDLPAEDPFSA
jgi:ribulose-5-phosphate 4-epimerase/fuculose-1-phosphate aldolase